VTVLVVPALLLAAAVLVSPAPARGRLPRLAAPTGSRHRVGAVTAVLAAVGASVSAPPALLLVAVIAGSTLAVWRRRRRLERRQRAEGRAMASALEVLVGELRVGAHPVRAFTVAAAESPGLVGLSLQRVAARTRLGADVPAGLLAVAQDSAVPAYWRRLAVFWELAAQRGLAMSVLMQAAHHDIVDRQRFTDRVRAALAGARATAVILAALPVLGVLLGQLIGAHPVRFLLGGGLGGVLLVAGVGLIAGGLAWADRITERLLR
jgi:tight adherence protein B